MVACAQQQTQGTEPVPATTISNEQISQYVRKAFNVPGNVTITVTDSPSTIAGLRQIRIQFSAERGSQEQEAWITKENQLIVGRSYDLAVDPWKKNREKVSFANVPATGGADAKVTIVEYSDFQCPYCSRAHLTMQQLLKDYDGKVKLVYKHLPLGIHNWAEDAAVASTCVYQQSNEAFWTLSDYLFTNQGTITKETLSQKILDATKASNLNADLLKQCMDGRGTLAVVQANMKEAESLGFRSTPSFLINGRTVIGAQELPQFKQIIDEALAETK